MDMIYINNEIEIDEFPSAIVAMTEYGDNGVICLQLENGTKVLISSIENNNE